MRSLSRSLVLRRCVSQYSLIGVPLMYSMTK